MTTRRTTRVLIFAALAAFALAALFFAPGDASAQCAMCKSSASGLDGAGAKNLNYAILLLLAPPVSIFCALFFAAYRRREPPDDRDE